MKKSKNILWGIVLIVVGLLLGLKSMGIINFNIFFEGWWTLFIIVPCFIGIFNDKDKTGNIIGLLIGVALLLSVRGIIDFDLIWKLTFPTILVVIGFSFIFKDTFNQKVSENIKKLNSERTDKNEYCATFSGQDIKLDGEQFKGTNLTAVFGGVKLDLTKSIIEQDVVINTSSIFGGIDIFVPNDVKVKVKSSAIFGGVSDERKNRQETENAKTIYINATCLFGGVEIK